MGPGSCPGSGWALGPLRGSWPRGSPPPAAAGARIRVDRSIMGRIATTTGSGEPGQGERIGSSCRPPAGPRWALLPPGPGRGPGSFVWLRLCPGPSPELLGVRIAAMGRITIAVSDQEARAKGSGTPERGAAAALRQGHGGAWVPPSFGRGPGSFLLAPAMPWALSGAPGREDHRHRQRPGSQGKGSGTPEWGAAAPAALQLDHGGPASSQLRPGPFVLPWLRLCPGPSPELLGVRITAMGRITTAVSDREARARGAGHPDGEQLPPSSRATVGPGCLPALTGALGPSPGSGYALGPLRGSWPSGSPPPAAAGKPGRGSVALNVTFRASRLWPGPGSGWTAPSWWGSAALRRVVLLWLPLAQVPKHKVKVRV